MQSPNVPVSSRTVVKCCCGKICKGAHGLKMHQRSNCQVVHGLNDELRADLEEQLRTNNTELALENDINKSNIDTVSNASFPELKKGVNLPMCTPNVHSN